jgi:ribonuclease E
MADEARTQGEFGGEPAEQPARWSREPRGDEQPEGEGGDGGGRGRRRRRRRGRGARGREDGFAPQGEGPRGDFPAAEDAGDQAMPQAAVPMSEGGEFAEASTGQADQAAPGAEGSGQRAPRGEGDEEGRRRRRGRRGGRRRRQEDGDVQGAPVAAAPVAGGFDAGPGEAPPPPAAPSYDDDLRARARELYGQHGRFGASEPVAPAPVAAAVPADDHAWPWNRKPEQAAEAAQPAPQPSSAPIEAPVAAQPAAVPEAKPSAPEASQPAPVAAEPAPPAQPEPEPEPQGPPRRGWWRRLTS